MSLPVAQKLIQRAEKGERLTTKERRHALAYLLVTDATKTQGEIAEMFGVSPRMIRADIKLIKEEKKSQLKEDDLGLVIVDLQMNIERQIHDLEVSKSKCKLATAEFRQHAMAIARIQLELNKALQDLGFLPKNLGNMTISNFSYKAEVNEAGVVSTQRVAEIVSSTPLLNGQTQENGADASEPTAQSTYVDSNPSDASTDILTTPPPETV